MTLHTRHGKIRSQSQRRYILVRAYFECDASAPHLTIAKRSDKIHTLAVFARRLTGTGGGPEWICKRAYGTYKYVIMDSVTGLEVAA